QEVAELIHQIDAQLLVLDADVHMHAADQEAARSRLHLLEERVIARTLGMLLARPYGERMCRDGKRCEPVLVRDVDDRAAQDRERLADLGDAAADSRADLDLRAHELGRDLLPVDSGRAL